MKISFQIARKRIIHSIGRAAFIAGHHFGQHVDKFATPFLEILAEEKYTPDTRVSCTYSLAYLYMVSRSLKYVLQYSLEGS